MDALRSAGAILWVEEVGRSLSSSLVDQRPFQMSPLKPQVILHAIDDRDNPVVRRRWSFIPLLRKGSINEKRRLYQQKCISLLEEKLIMGSHFPRDGTVNAQVR